MANPTDESGEDLFDDLDKFFAPIEETDWPEPEADAPPPRARSRSPRPTEEPAGNDLFPEGWDSIDQPDEGEALLEAAASPAPDDTSTYEFSIDDVAEAEAPQAPVREDQTADWAAAVGGEGEEEESFLFREDEAPAAAPPSRAEAAESREPGELTLDDLKVAPPEYSALPGPEDERSTPSSIFGDEELSFATPDPPAPTPRAPAASTPAPPDPGASERAADHFADGVRADTGRIEDDLLAGLDSTPTSTPRTVKVGTDEPVMGHGPAWEDPTSQAVGNEPGAGMPRMGRNLSAALISGVFLGALALILVAIGPAPFAFLAGAVLLAAQAELYAVARTRGYQPATALGLVIGGLIVYAGYNKGEAAMSAMVVLGLILTYLWYMAAPQKARKGTLVNAAITVLGIVYIPFMAAFIFSLLPLPGGRAIVIAIIALNVIYDVSAFAIGSLWGNRSLAATISPNKSWEGAFAASLITLFAAIAFGPQIAPFKPFSSFGLALVVIVMAPLGDLAESALKRDLGVKDMSTVMPGHGGLLDRIDSLLFVLPSAYFFFRILFF